MKLKKTTLLTLFSISIVACKQTEPQENQNHTTNKEISSETKAPKNKDTSNIVSKPKQDVLPPEQYKSVEIEEIGWELMEKERFGEIKLNMDSTSILRILGQPDSTTTITYWGADGDYHNEWIYDDGLTIGMTRMSDHPGRKFDRCISHHISLISPSTLYSNRRIGIGSSKQEVLSNYSIAIEDSIEYDDQMVAGTVYGGLIFQFEQDKVASIFLGTAAE